ncbi:MAG TPA: hypothetical protein VGD40_21140 [Chryseosolibacter sp.]
MSLLKYIERLKQMDDLIRRKATGTPEQFSRRLGLSKSVLMDELKDLKELGAEVEYCRERRSYYYENEFILKIGTLPKNHLHTLKGGFFFHSDNTGTCRFIFDLLSWP